MSGGYFTPACPFFCSGHIDGSTEEVHTTGLDDRFGVFVIVTKTGDGPVLVALTDVPMPQYDMTPDAARLLAFHLWQAAGLADRYAFPLAADDLQRLLRELLEAREVSID